MDYPAFERRLLRLIFGSNVPLTPVHVAYYLDLPIALARQHLDTMLQAGILELDSDDFGRIVYIYPMRPPLSELRAPAPPHPRRRRRKRHRGRPVAQRASSSSSSGALVPVTTRRPAAPDSEGYSPAAAAALSLFLPGVGQIYSGRVPQGIGWLIATGLGYLLFLVPGLILHICCIVNAAAVPIRVHGISPRHGGLVASAR
jgi:hypothetical protein